MNAVIFDLDGVILDSEAIHIRLERELFIELGFNITHEEHESFVGITGREMFARIANAHPRRWHAVARTIEELVALERGRYLAELRSGNVPYVTGALELIGALDRADRPIAVASSAPRDQIEFALTQAQIERMIRCTVSGDEVSRGKPDPEIFLRAAECLDVAPADCWVIEDSRHGVAAAIAAGMRCVGFVNPNSGEQDLSAATSIVTEIAEIPRLIQLENAGST